jgi:hypothetical protein
MQTRSVVLALLALVACGNNNNGNGDGGNGDGGSNGSNTPDAAPLTCDYTEASDAANAATAEMTGVTLGAANKVLCGKIDGGHFNSTTNVVDVDAYTVAVSGTAELIVEFADTAPASLTDFQVTITDTNVNPTLLNTGDYTGALGDHGAYLAELPAGNYDIVVTATNGADITAAVPYKVRLLADQPTTRCPDLTAMPADYTEANDGAMNVGNDVALADFSKTPSFVATTATTDNAETSALTVDTSKNLHLAGSSGTPSPANADQYIDRDTFAFTTGASTNELSIRLDWPGATADLDYIVFEANKLTAPNQVSAITSKTQAEFQTFAVKPSTSYWLWVGAHTGSTGQPVAYSASLCGATFSL